MQQLLTRIASLFRSRGIEVKYVAIEQWQDSEDPDWSEPVIVVKISGDLDDVVDAWEEASRISPLPVLVEQDEQSS